VSTFTFPLELPEASTKGSWEAWDDVHSLRDRAPMEYINMREGPYDVMYLDRSRPVRDEGTKICEDLLG